MQGRLARHGPRLLCCILVVGGVARAHDTIPPPNNNVEMSLMAGYAQGFGPVAAGVPTLQGFGSAGGEVLLAMGWRIDPRWAVGVYGEVAVFGAGSVPGSDQAFNFAAGLQGQYHLSPSHRCDPWVGLGVGWRGYWADLHGGDYALQGLDLARLQVGLDFRVTPTFAIGPVAGVTLTEFLSVEPLGAGGYQDTHDRKVNTFVFAGIGWHSDL